MLTYSDPEPLVCKNSLFGWGCGGLGSVLCVRGRGNNCILLLLQHCFLIAQHLVVVFVAALVVVPVQICYVIAFVFLLLFTSLIHKYW